MPLGQPVAQVVAAREHEPDRRDRIGDLLDETHDGFRVHRRAEHLLERVEHHDDRIIGRPVGQGRAEALDDVVAVAGHGAPWRHRRGVGGVAAQQRAVVAVGGEQFLERRAGDLPVQLRGRVQQQQPGMAGGSDRVDDVEVGDRAWDSGRRGSAAAGHEPLQLQRLAHAAAGVELQHRPVVGLEEGLEGGLGSLPRHISRAAVVVVGTQGSSGKVRCRVIAQLGEFGSEERQPVGGVEDPENRRALRQVVGAVGLGIETVEQRLRGVGVVQQPQVKLLQEPARSVRHIGQLRGQRPQRIGHGQLQHRRPVLLHPPLGQRAFANRCGQVEPAVLVGHRFQPGVPLQQIQVGRPRPLQQPVVCAGVERLRHGAAAEALPERGGSRSR